jgi:hypothetical protein
VLSWREEQQRLGRSVGCCAGPRTRSNGEWTTVALRATRKGQHAVQDVGNPLLVGFDRIYSIVLQRCCGPYVCCAVIFSVNHLLSPILQTQIFIFRSVHRLQLKPAKRLQPNEKCKVPSGDG